MARFLDVFEDITREGAKIPTMEYLEYGKYPIIDQGQSYISGYCNSEKGLFTDVPAIIFGDHTRIVKYVEQPCFLGADGVKLLKARKDFLSDYKYLYYVLCNAKIPNTGYNRHFKWLKEMEIPVPPLDEQRKIAAVLDKVSNLVAKRRKQLDKLDELVKARFVEMFGDQQINPHRYERVKLSDVAMYFNGLTYKPENIANTGTIVLRSGNIQNSQLDFVDTVRVDCPIKERLMVQENDILMCSRNGSAKLVGKVALIKNLQEPMSFGAFMMIIRSSYYSYLISYFQTDAFRQQIQTGATTTINQITGRMLDNVTIPLPPMMLVEQFADFMRKVDKSKLVIQKSFENLELLKKSLMQQYFG